SVEPTPGQADHRHRLLPFCPPRREPSPITRRSVIAFSVLLTDPGPSLFAASGVKGRDARQGRACTRRKPWLIFASNQRERPWVRDDWAVDGLRPGDRADSPGLAGEARFRPAGAGGHAGRSRRRAVEHLTGSVAESATSQP